MKYIVNQREMKAIDDFSIQTIGIPSLVLMERAALAAALRIKSAVKAGEKVLAVAGAGNNGADAAAAARILYCMGCEAAVCLVGDEAKASPEMKKQLEIIRNLHIPEYNKVIDFNAYAWIIDGLFGIGLSRPVGGVYADAVKAINASSAKVVSVDIPSGISADDGQILGVAVRADTTVTFGQNKLGLVLYPGAEFAGEVFVEDIGFPEEALDFVRPKVRAFEKEDVRALLPGRTAYSNKGSYGRLLVIAGSENMCGACYFSAKAAYKMGVGLVRVMTPDTNRIIIQQQLPEAVLAAYTPDKLTREEILDQLSWADAVVIGPGLSTKAYAAMLLNTVLTESRVPVVVDADGLNILSKNMSLLEQKQCPVIVTPHLGEMSRLTGLSIKEISNRLCETADVFAKRYDVICVLKDARTVTADGQGQMIVNLSGNNGMATGGSGDVLSGIIGALVCGGVDAFTAGALGAYIHGLSGDEAKKMHGVYGLLASDIIQYISNIVC